MSRLFIIFLLFSSFLGYTQQDSVYFLRLNVHFMLNDDGTGNFSETDDGIDSTNNGVNGYLYAQRLIEVNNWKLSDNKRMQLVNKDSSNQENLPIRYRYLLTGIYFHRDSELADYNHGQRLLLLKKYGVNPESEFNIFLSRWPDNVPEARKKDGGVAGCLGCGNLPVISLVSPWYDYCRRRSVDWLGPAFGTLLNHEIGHLLNLHHNWANDYCDDTPNHDQKWCGHNPKAGYLVDNNMMSYNCGQNAVTKCQLERVYKSLATKHKNRTIRKVGYKRPPYVLIKLDSVLGKRDSKMIDASWRRPDFINESSYYIEIKRIKKRNGKGIIRKNRVSRLEAEDTFEKASLETIYGKKLKRGTYQLDFLFKSSEGLKHETKRFVKVK